MKGLGMCSIQKESQSTHSWNPIPTSYRSRSREEERQTMVTIEQIERNHDVSKLTVLYFGQSHCSYFRSNLHSPSSVVPLKQPDQHLSTHTSYSQRFSAETSFTPKSIGTTELVKEFLFRLTYRTSNICPSFPLPEMTLEASFENAAVSELLTAGMLIV